MNKNIHEEIQIAFNATILLLDLHAVDYPKFKEFSNYLRSMKEKVRTEVRQ